MSIGSTHNNMAANVADYQAHPHYNSAYIATPESVVDPAWYIDSGATNHITSNLNNLSIRSAYRGNEKLVVGNKHMLFISNIGNTTINSHKTISKIAS